MRLAICVLFVLSGFAGLVYEITWSRLLASFLGSSVHAVSLVLAMFMLGFALGGGVGGRLSRSSLAGKGGPLRLYGLIQLGLSVCGLAFAPALEAVASLAGGTGAAAESVRLVGAAILLLIPTVLMGATFPLVTAAWVRQPHRIGVGAGLLSAANLLGAAAGALAAGFVLIRAIGIGGSMLTAAAINLIVFAIAFFLLRSPARSIDRQEPSAETERPDESVPDESVPDESVRDESVREGARRVEAWLAASGFAALALQVAWTRILAFYLEGFTFTFSAIVATYLVGMFAGSLVFGLFCRSMAASRALLRVAVFGWATTSVLTVAALERFPHGPESIRFVFSPDAESMGYAAGLFLAAFLFLLPPTFFLGGVLPAAAGALGAGAGTVGSRIGRLYAILNLGSAAGALLSGFLLLAVVGMKGTVVLISGLALLGMAVDALRDPRGRSSRTIAAAVAVLVFALSVAGARPWRPMIESSHVFRDSRGSEHQLVTTREGAAGTASVVDNLRTGERFLYTEDFLAAGTGDRYHYMRLLGHLPALFAEQRQRAMIIGFGSGTTVASVARHPFESIRIVEILPEVLEVAAEFDSVNASVLDDPRVDLVIGDGRHDLRYGDGSFDVITLEPLMPYTPGAASLYTRDFYELGRTRLAEGGWFCQWIPIHGIRTDHFRMLTRSFLDAFPNSLVFLYETSVALIGTTGPIDVPLTRLIERAAEESVAADLETAGYPSGMSLLGSFVTGGDELEQWVGNVPAMTDDRPVLEFYPLPRQTATSYGSDNIVALREAVANPARFFSVEDSPAGDALLGEMSSWRLVAGELLLGFAQAFRAGYLALVGGREEAAKFNQEAELSFARAVRERSDCLVAVRWMIDHHYRRLVAIGADRLRKSQSSEARAAFREAAELIPERHLAHYYIGVTLDRDGRADDAIAAFRAALSRFERHADSHWYLADLLAEQGARNEARRLYERALSLTSVAPFDDARREKLVRALR